MSDEKTAKKWDHTVDFLVVGSGAGGMTAAAVAHDKGAKALIIEKDEYYGGSTAMSGGALWVPNNHLMAALGVDGTPEGALDYLIFDCPPGWDVLSVNILMAVTDVLCPVALQALPLEGMKTFFGYLMSAQRLNPDLQLKYILPTMFDRRTRQSFDIFGKLRKLFRKQICHPIRQSVRLSEAPGVGKTIFEYRRTSTGADDYDQLTRRIIDDGIREKAVPRFF